MLFIDMKKEIKEIISIIRKPYMNILPGNIAFSFMMAILPIISVIVFITNKLNMVPIFNLEIIPKPVVEMILIILNSNDINSIFFLILAIITSSAGMDALIIASNVIYETDSSYLKRKLKSLFLTLLIILMIIINFVLLVIGDKLLNLIIIKYNLNMSTIVFSIIKWPIALILLFIIVKIIYIVAPSKKINSKLVNKGTIITTLLLLISSLLYSLYIDSSLYIDRYGGLSNIIVLLIWLYILSFILVLGTAINVNEYKKVIV